MELIKEEQKLDGQHGGRRGVLQKVLRAAVSRGQYLKEVRGYMTGARKLQGKRIFHYPPRSDSSAHYPNSHKPGLSILSSLCKPSSRHSVAVNTGRRDW